MSPKAFTKVINTIEQKTIQINYKAFYNISVITEQP